ncbi:hypothetical protein QTP88_008655 [Uroleucon formosanum]
MFVFDWAYFLWVSGDKGQVSTAIDFAMINDENHVKVNLTAVKVYTIIMIFNQRFATTTCKQTRSKINSILI